MLAGVKAPRPDTLTQTGQITSQIVACRRGGPYVLNVSTAPSACAWCLGRAAQLAIAIMRSSRLSVGLAMRTPNSSQSHRHRSIMVLRDGPIDSTSPPLSRGTTAEPTEAQRRPLHAG